MRVLVVGASGLLGSNVVKLAHDRGCDVIGTYHSTSPTFDIPLEPLDMQKPERIHNLVKTWNPNVVVNCAAMTDVDGCEANPGAARAVNAEGPKELSIACERLGTRLVHVSTDYVFDGTTSSPYRESAEPSPVQTYGATKLTGEQAIQSADVDVTVVRLSFVYGIHRSENELTGFPSWVKERLRRGERTPLFTDQHITPSRAGQAASTILELIENDVTGVFHVASRSCVRPYDFGQTVASYLGKPDDLIVPSSMDEVERPARRPRYTCLDVDKVESVLARSQPTLQEDVETMASVISID